MASSAVNDLHKRIQILDDSISQHEKAIKELEAQKSAARGELNALRDPMGRLPLELSSMIFKKCFALESYDRRPHACTTPMLLMQICHSWTQITLATPSLWTDIHVTSPSEQFWNLLEIWLDRAQRLPVKLSLYGCRESDVEDVVKERAGQFVELAAWMGMSDLPRDTDPWEIQPLSNMPFPALEKLTLGTCHHPDRQPRGAECWSCEQTEHEVSAQHAARLGFNTLPDDRTMPEGRTRQDRASLWLPEA